MSSRPTHAPACRSWSVRALSLAICFASALATAAPVPSPVPLAPVAKSSAAQKTAAQDSPAQQKAAQDSAAPASATRWSFAIDARELKQGLLSIEMTLHGFAGPVPLCVDMRGAGRSVRDLREMSADADAGPAKSISPIADRPNCFLAHAPAQAPLAVHYQLDLGDLSRHHGDPDWATRSGDDYVFNEESVLLRPEPMPDEAPIEITFTLPDGVSVAAPWKQLDGSGRRFASDVDQYDSGSYIAIGHLRPLVSIDSRGGKFDVTLVSAPHKASDKALIEWVKKPAMAVADFYRGVPSGRATVTLIPVPGMDGPGVFGSTLHRAAPSAVLFFGADAEDPAFLDDWLPTHELFHIGNPRTSTRISWFNEGSATYYQDVLRARAGMIAPELIWGDLYDGFRRYCPREDGDPLADESAHLRERHRYTNVYWGGACIFFRADVLIREHSGGKRSLDDLLRELLARSDDELLDEAQLIEALDQAAGSKQISEMIRTSKGTPMAELYRKLGIEPVGDDKVKLDNSAPEAAIRRAILGEKSP